MLQSQLDDFITNYKEDIRCSAQELLDKQMPAITEDLFGLFEKTGNRIQYEQVYFTRRRFLAVLGMNALLEEPSEQQTPTLSKLITVMQDICSEECWALPAHVDRISNSNWRITVDLFASETAQTLAELTDRLGDRLPKDVCETVKEHIDRRVLRPFFTSGIPYAGWERANHNWNAVCSGAIGSACLHLMRDDPDRLSRCLARICESLQFYIGGFADDGACMEGLGYYTYGMTFFSNFAQELYEYSKGETDLFTGDWAQAESWRTGSIAAFPAKCFFKDGISVSFSDSDPHETFRVGLSSVLALHFGRSGAHLVEDEELFPGMARAAGLHSDTCYRFAALKMDLLYTQQYRIAMGPQSATPKQFRAYCLPAAQWYIGDSEAGAGFACKGGHNDEPHNHNDVGSFIYEAGGAVFLADLGLGEYTRAYFGSERYDILCNSSFGHSVPIVGGKGQCAGRKYAAGSYVAAQEGTLGTVRLEAASAYPEGSLKQFHRVFDFDCKTGCLHVQDRFVLPNPSGGISVTENLITQISPVITGNRIELSFGGAVCVIDINGCETDVSVKKQLHRNHQGETEPVYALQWEVPCPEGHGSCNFRVWRTCGNPL